MTNWKGFGKKEFVAFSSYFPGIFLGGTEENHGKLKRRLLVRLPKFERSTARLQTYSVTSAEHNGRAV
jgi:hypothetical protein